MEENPVSHDYIKLTSAELSQIWTIYLNDSMSICVLKHFLEHVKDPDIAAVIDEALKVSEKHIPKLLSFFAEEGYPSPHGFKESEDLNIGAPRLYSDTFSLNYIAQMGIMEMNAYSMAISLSARRDLHAYFSMCLSESVEIHRRATDVLLAKGLFIRPPYIGKPEMVKFINDQTFLGGYFDKKRPITGLEIANVYNNLQRNALGRALMIGFAQVSKNQKIIEYMKRGKHIASKHVQVFGEVLTNDDLPVPGTWDSEITDSQTAPFSEKLMMFHTAALIAASIGYYGIGLSSSFRKDLSLLYVRLIAEVADYAKDGAQLLIEHSWLEEPPSAVDRNRLIKK